MMLLLLALMACTDKDPNDSGTLPSTDGGGTDGGGLTDGGGTDGGGFTDGGGTDGGGTDGGTTDGGTTDGGSSDGGTSDGGTASDGRDEACQLAADAAIAYVASLSKEQAVRGVAALDSEARHDWTNLPASLFPRDGLYFVDLSPEQLALVDAMLATSLSSQGSGQVADIIAVEAWKEAGGDDLLTPDLYSVIVFGSPSRTEPWAWQLDGHHLAVNFTFACPEAVITPAFWGVEPEVVPDGDIAGLRPMADEIDRALELLFTLDADQLDQAVISEVALPDLLTGPGRDDAIPLSPEGLPASALDSAQRELLLALIATFVEDAPTPHAALRMVQAEEELDETWLAWAGPTDGEGMFYYRVQGPSLFIELDHSMASNHLHSVYRHPADDYGATTLAEHYALYDHGG